MFLSEIDKEAINKLQIGHFEGKIHIVDDDVSFIQAMTEIKHHPVLGFDTETKPSFKKGNRNNVALIQLSNHSEAWLFRINRIGIPPDLKKILEDDNILKIGAGLNDDMQRINRVTSIQPAGFLDLQKYVEAFGIESKGLAKIVAIVLGYKISKSQQISNWEAEELTGQQMTYAATDAWVCLEVYDKLRRSVEKFI